MLASTYAATGKRNKVAGSSWTMRQWRQCNLMVLSIAACCSFGMVIRGTPLDPQERFACFCVIEGTIRKWRFEDIEDGPTKRFEVWTNSRIWSWKKMFDEGVENWLKNAEVRGCHTCAQMYKLATKAVVKSIEESTWDEFLLLCWL